MVGKSSSVLRLILMFEGMAKKEETKSVSARSADVMWGSCALSPHAPLAWQTKPPAKRSLADLP